MHGKEMRVPSGDAEFIRVLFGKPEEHKRHLRKYIDVEHRIILK